MTNKYLDDGPQIKEEQNSDKENTLQSKIGRWPQDEHAKYIVFIDFFKQVLNSREKRRNNKIFKLMASMLKTRTPIQCRSHHIKLLRTFRTIDQIKKMFIRKIGQQAYKQLQQSVKSDQQIFKNTNKKQQNIKCEEAQIANQTQKFKDASVQTDLSLLPCKIKDQIENPVQNQYHFNLNMLYPPASSAHMYYPFQV